MSRITQIRPISYPERIARAKEIGRRIKDWKRRVAALPETAADVRERARHRS